MRIHTHVHTDIRACMSCMHMDTHIASLCIGVVVMSLHLIPPKATRFSTNPSKSVPRTGSSRNQDTKLHYQYAGNCLGTGTPLGGSRGRRQNGYGEKTSRVENCYLSRVAEAVQLKAGSCWRQ